MVNDWHDVQVALKKGIGNRGKGKAFYCGRELLFLGEFRRGLYEYSRDVREVEGQCN